VCEGWELLYKKGFGNGREGREKRAKLFAD
jgi:hypothetical protein